MSSTGRRKCCAPGPEAAPAQPLTNLIPFCDGAGTVTGYVALLYDAGPGTVTRLDFDTALQLAGSPVAGSVCAGGGGGAVVQGDRLESLDGVALGYLVG